MSEQLGEKTEQATPRKLEEALKKGQFPRSAEVQTVFVLAAALLALMFTGSEIWRQLGLTLSTTLGHLHSFPVTPSAMQKQFIDAVLVVVKCVWPVLLATILGGLLAGGIQSRFQTASEALTVDWGRVNPATGFKRLVSMKAAAPAAMAVLKLSAIILLSYGEVKSVLSDPIFYSTVSADRIAQFLAQSSLKILISVA